MAATAPSPLEPAAPAVPEHASALETLRIWGLHLLCFVVPVSTLAFLLTAPHRWWAALPWLGGLVAEWAVAFAIAALLGWGAFAFYVLQAWGAIRLLEAVNYFEHWGIVRRGKKPTPIDSWDTDSWFTLYTLVGLSRHADHHAFATRPYQQLRHWEESPKLPTGYFGMVLMVFVQNERFQKLMTRELQRRKLGPFAEEAQAA